MRARPEFRDFNEKELAFIKEFKRGELHVAKGETILEEGVPNQHLYTVLSGWGFRYKAMSDGRRQIVNYAMPGDLVGLQGSLMGEMQHSVEALSPMILCTFERARLFSLFEAFPQLAFDVTWIASRQECMLDENLLTVGRRTAIEKVAYLVVFLLSRFVETGLQVRNGLDLPITQQHVADTLGLSVVHTNKTIRKLADRKLLSWGDGGCRVNDVAGLRTIARWLDPTPRPRPFL
ncbi:Crp/Fnr family transcriptional regulator [Chelativorans sp. AA-79]|uniref:Crp/Fnr family transcriptional regulator n=1 Tax=Chelativorans sp. AA-79 TaxID=3028735 RepID=UPI0023F8614C|nr:Crp/Fnr family transcriptional regulator [Chelativorans sp. AA-79]WEX10041.1 Crp/Fnr family transcriptional regulator [Chelativorans sp. AA-79]